MIGKCGSFRLSMRRDFGCPLRQIQITRTTLETVYLSVWVFLPFRATSRNFNSAGFDVRLCRSGLRRIHETEKALRRPRRHDDGPRKHLGEAASIVLARRLGLPIVLDDQDAANYARSTEHLTVYRSLNLVAGHSRG